MARPCGQREALDKAELSPIIKQSIEYYMNATDALYQHLARIGQAIASGPRLALLDLLRQGPRTVEALAQEVGLTLANASQHLKVLRQARLVEAEKRGIFVTYRLADQAVDDFYGALRGLAETHLAEVQQIARTFVEKRGALEPVDRHLLLERLRSGEVTVLDVRPAEEYRAAHIPGAVSVPLKELEKRLGDLPRHREIVAYCRGPYCVFAPEAVKLLRARGYRAMALDDGVGEWRARGLPLAAGETP
jgi:rhodanese-related sulfurtransferase/DNA-binding transcriptional ArsR family regulator